MTRHCACTRMGDDWPCTAPPTAEDLRCNTCRAGCNAGSRSVTDGGALTSGGGPHFRITIDWGPDSWALITPARRDPNGPPAIP